MRDPSICVALGHVFANGEERPCIDCGATIRTHDLSDLWRELAEWSDANFGNSAFRGPMGPLRHLEKEVAEAIAAIGTESFLEEMGDALSILMDAARRGGLTLDDLVAQMFRKLAINRTRTWSAPNASEPVEHVREPR